MNLDTIQRMVQKAVEHRNQWREEAKKCYDFVAGTQWTPEEGQVMEDQNRPVPTFNRVAPIVDAIVGHEATNRQATAYLPRQLGSTQVSEVLSAAAQWVRDECGADGEESDAFADAVITGEGWTETRVSYEEDLDGKIIIERIDPREMDIDPSASRKNYVDAKWVQRTRRMDRSAAREIWPEAQFEPAQGRKGASEPIDVITAAFYHLDSGAQGRGNAEVDQVLIHDFQWWELEPVYRIDAKQLVGIDPAIGQTMVHVLGPDVVKPSESGLLTLTDVQWKAIEPLVPFIKPTIQKRRVYKRIFWSGSEVLEEKDTPTRESYSYKAITAKRDHTKRMWYGIVRNMRDPQRWSNKFMSLALEITGAAAKGGIMAEEDAFVDPRKAEDDWADPNRIVMLNTGGIEKIAPRPQGNPPAGMQQLMMYANQSINDVAGVNPAVMGFSQALDVSGKLEETRKEAGLNLLSYLFDSLRRYRKEQGVLLMKMIRDYLPPGRLIKIVNQGDTQYVPLAYDDHIERYDIVVDEAPTAPNVKERTWDSFIALMGASPMAAQAFGQPQFLLPLLKYSPFPSALVNEWTQAAMKPNPMAQQGQVLELKQKAAEVGRTQAETQLKTAQAQHIGQGSPQELQSDLIEQQTEKIKAAAEVEAAKAKMAGVQMDHAGRILQHHLDTQKALQDAALATHKANLAHPPQGNV